MVIRLKLKKKKTSKISFADFLLLTDDEKTKIKLKAWVPFTFVLYAES